MKYALFFVLITISQISLSQVLRQDSNNVVGEFYDSTNPGKIATIGDISAFAHGLTYACVEQVQGTQQEKERFCACAKNKIIENMSSKLSPIEAKAAISGSAHGQSPWPHQSTVMSGFDSCAQS